VSWAGAEEETRKTATRARINQMLKFFFMPSPFSNRFSFNLFIV
jgi:hypothetical protein